MAGSYLRQSTASQARATPPFLDDTDFKTAETALTIANTDVKLIVNGGASADKNSGGGTHRANGVYGLTFDATDTATVGEMLVSVKVAGALAVFMKFWVLEEAVYDALFAASAPGYLQPTTAGRTLDVSAGGEAGVDWANVGSPTTAVNLSGTTVNLVNTLTTYTGNTPQTGDAFARLGAPAGASVSADIAAVKTDTAAILDDTGASGVVVAAASKTGYSLAAAGLDSITVETGLNARQALSIIASSASGVLAGAATTTITIAAAGVPATNRVTATVDSSGNRSAVTLNPPS